MRMPKNKNLKTDRALFTANTIAERVVLVIMCRYVNVNAVRKSLIYVRHSEL